MWKNTVNNQIFVDNVEEIAAKDSFLEIIT